MHLVGVPSQVGGPTRCTESTRLTLAKFFFFLLFGSNFNHIFDGLL